MINNTTASNALEYAKDNAKISISCEYCYLDEFYEGRAMICFTKPKKMWGAMNYGYINIHGDVIFEFKDKYRFSITDNGRFKDGFAIVIDTSIGEGIQQKRNLIDRNGKFLFQEFAEYVFYKENIQKYCLIYKDYRLLFDPKTKEFKKIMTIEKN